MATFAMALLALQGTVVVYGPLSSSGGRSSDETGNLRASIALHARRNAAGAAVALSRL
jgi:L-asparaginase/Glu-tRNA(Gln) amidotransferase subunit D